MRLSETLNPPVQKVIAAGRVLLTAFALFAAGLDPAHPDMYAGEISLLLVSYLVFASALVLMPITLWWRIDARFSSLEHAIDTLFVSLLVFLTDILSGPFFAFFTFILFSATLRWGWRAVVTTTCVLLLLLAGLRALQGPLAPVELNRVAIRAGYLVVITGTVRVCQRLHREQPGASVPPGGSSGVAGEGRRAGPGPAPAACCKRGQGAARHGGLETEGRTGLAFGDVGQGGFHPDDPVFSRC